MAPPPAAANKTALQLFEDAQWEAAYAANPALKMLRRYDNGEGSEAAEAARNIREAWRGLGDASRTVWTDKARALATRKRQYAAAQVGAAGKPWHVSLLAALLSHSPRLHTLNLNSGGLSGGSGGWRTYDLTPPRCVLASGDALLQRVQATWGATLRVLHLGKSKLAVGDVHALLAACAQLAWLDASKMVVLQDDGAAEGDGAALFDTMAPHAALRSVALPQTAQQNLLAYTLRLCAHCPALREIDAETFDACAPQQRDDSDDGGDSDSGDHGMYGGEPRGMRLVAICARAAAARGVRRFLCSTYFADGGSEGEYGSDGGSVGEYCGDGDVLKYLRH